MIDPFTTFNTKDEVFAQHRREYKQRLRRSLVTKGWNLWYNNGQPGDHPYRHGTRPDRLIRSAYAQAASGDTPDYDQEQLDARTMTHPFTIREILQRRTQVDSRV